MRRIYVSTVGRGKDLEEASRVYCIDYDTGNILASVRLPPAMFDLKNPRGGVRGARGICFHQGCIYCAGFDAIFQLDSKDLFIRQAIWSKEVQDIHQIYLIKEHITDEILVCNTRNNKISRFFIHDYHNMKDLFCFSKYWDSDLSFIDPGFPPPEWDEGNKDTLHFNSIDIVNNYGLLCKIGGICDIKNKKLLFKDEKYRGSHDLVTLPTGEIAMNHSRQRRTITFDPSTWQEKRTLLELPQKPLWENCIAEYGWMRGMSYESTTDTLFVGSAPAMIFGLEGISKNDYKIKEIKISDKIVESVFGVISHPEDWKNYVSM